MAKQIYDLRQLSWTLTGWDPFEWQLSRSGDPATGENACVPALPAHVPGLVQKALFQAGLLPDWNSGVQTQKCEWVENRHWVFTTHLPSDWLHGKRVRLRALGLDHAGWVLLNGQVVATFENAFLPYQFDLSEKLPRNGEAVALSLVFDCPPRWLGQFGLTSHMTEWKPRFYYTWDWMPRLVQIGVWDDLFLEVGDGQELGTLHCVTRVEQHTGTEALGMLFLQGEVNAARDASVEVTLSEKRSSAVGSTSRVFRAQYRPEELVAGIQKTLIPIKLWHPNGSGEQHLYQVQVELLDNTGACQDRLTRQVGFKTVTWQPCEGAPDHADPWLCVVNDTPVFLQGVNWTPIRPNFADLSREDYQQRLSTYQRMGCNVMRVWGGAFLEKSCFYELCDELGLLVWQEFPLSSSGIENAPPEDTQSRQTLCTIALSSIQRRQHHVSLLLWSGGNELEERDQPGTPVTHASSLIRELGQIVAAADPGRRFLTTSPSGPRFLASEEEMGLGVHWDVHGPWMAEGALEQAWTRYWQKDDALFRSEVGAPGTSSAALIKAHADGLAVLPATRENALWRRTGWWIESHRFVEEHRHDPETLEEYVQWSQQRQVEALRIAVCTSKKRFPRMGGLLIWMGHDAFPCTANTSILDFSGEPKPAAHALAELFLAPSERS